MPPRKYLTIRRVNEERLSCKTVDPSLSLNAHLVFPTLNKRGQFFWFQKACFLDWKDWVKQFKTSYTITSNFCAWPPPLDVVILASHWEIFKSACTGSWPKLRQLHFSWAKTSLCLQILLAWCCQIHFEQSVLVLPLHWAHLMCRYKFI